MDPFAEVMQLVKDTIGGEPDETILLGNVTLTPRGERNTAQWLERKIAARVPRNAKGERVNALACPAFLCRKGEELSIIYRDPDDQAVQAIPITESKCPTRAQLMFWAKGFLSGGRPEGEERTELELDGRDLEFWREYKNLMAIFEAWEISALSFLRGRREYLQAKIAAETGEGVQSDKEEEAQTSGVETEAEV
jgi:hypothetical protein